MQKGVQSLCPFHLGRSMRTRGIPRPAQNRCNWEPRCWKSSLIESISEITLPRSTGTCTRCPIEVMLQSDTVDSVWKCQVSVFDNMQGRSVQFGEVLYQKRDVELVLRRAQLATLNPDTTVTTFVNLDD